jgi:hypothetical protein
MAVRPVEAGAAGASEVAKTVQGAHDKLSALARVAQVTGDPAGPVLEALAAQLDAEHRLFDDLKRTLSEVRRPEAVFTDKQVDDVGRRLLGACQVWSAGMVRASIWRSWAALAGALGTVLVIGAGGGYWLGSSTEAKKYVDVPAFLGTALTGQDAAQWVNLIRLNDISRVNRMCSEQSGGTACSFSFWTKKAIP